LIVVRQFPSIVNMLECMNFIKDSQRVTRPKTTSTHADSACVTT
jgi:hypothetical protein